MSSRCCKLRLLLGIAFAGMVSTIGVAPLWAEPVMTSILPSVENAPRIDGKIESGEWQQALDLGLLQTAKANDEFPSTRAWIAYDKTHLYVAVRAGEPFPRQIKTKVIPDEKDGDVALDDCVHLFVDVGNNGKMLFQIISNAAGTLYDASILNRMISAAWDSGAVARTRVNADNWEVEMAVPLQAMGHELVRGEKVAVNVVRSRYATGRRQVASLAKGALTTTNDFAHLLVDGAMQAGPTTVIATQRGPFFQGKPGYWKFEVTQTSNSNSQLAIKFPGLKTATRVYSIEPGTQEIVYEIPADQVQKLSRLVMEYNGQPIYNAAYRVEEIPAPDRVAVTANPLFDELVSANPGGLSKDGVMMWAHDVNGPPHPAKVARRTGTIYNPEMVLQQLARDRSILIAPRRSSILQTVLNSDANLKAVVLLDTRSSFAKGAQRAGDGAFPWMLDPYASETLLEDARETIELAKKHPQIWGIFMGDESWEKNDGVLKWFLDNHRSDYPALVKADAEIKAKYGFGKYGLPESSTDPNMFRWIATRRWEADKMLELAQLIKEMIRQQAPHLKLVSWDNRNGHQPFELHRWGPIFDVITGQLYPARDKYQQNIAFNTKLLHDLTGTKELWPVPHIEHYPANFTPQETNELLSQVFRSGATGMHIYPSDTIGRRAGKAAFPTDRVGAPERWQVVESVIDRLQKPFTVRQPKADTAIFYSNTSYQGQVDSRHTQEPEWIYTILGPRLKSALSFIDEYQVLAPDNLKQYKIIYVPYANVVDDDVYNALQSYVQGGGTLVVNDPLAFRYRSDGSERSSGVIVPPLTSTKAVKSGLLRTAQGQELPPTGTRYALKTSAAQALVRDDANVPVVQEMATGKGKVLFFGMNPLVPATIKDAAWIEVFRDIQQAAGAHLDDDIWRFRFPLPTPQPASHPAGMCLTNNYFEWRLSEPLPVLNAAVGGHYQLSVAASEPAGAAIPFAKGRLTDRREGALAAIDAAPTDFELRWKMEKPLDITFTFDEPVQAQQARLFFSRTLPAGWCEVSADGQNWQKVHSWQTQETNAANEVALQNIQWPAAAVKQVRFHFNAAPGKRLFLAEVDVWGTR